MPSSDFKPFATGPGALVLTPQFLATEPWIQSGFTGGVADAASLNTLWRQGNFVAAGITQWMANVLNQSIFDDGNLNNFISLFGSALTAGSGGGVSSFDTRTGAVTLLLSDVVSALGYQPVISFAGPGETPRNGVVTLTGADVIAAELYTPLNKGGDTMTGYLSGPEPASGPNFATKNYVDRAVAGIATGTITNTSISQYAGEWDFPLPYGGIMKVGQWVTGYGNAVLANPASGSMQPNVSYQINFANPFPTVCAGVTLGTLSVNEGKATVILASRPSNSSFSVWAVVRAFNTFNSQETIYEGFIWGFLWIALGF